MGRRGRRSSWSYSKSYRVGKAFRINVSKRGVGYSFGVKGFRISSGPRGRYLNAGRGGFRYRQKLNSTPVNLSNQRQGNGQGVGCLGAIVIFVVITGISSSAGAGFIAALIWYFGSLAVISASRSPQNPSPQNEKGTETWGRGSRTWSPDSWDQEPKFEGYAKNPTQVKSRAQTQPQNKSKSRLKVTFDYDEAFNIGCASLEGFLKAALSSQRMWLISHSEVNSNIKSAASMTLDREALEVRTFDESHPAFKDYEINAPVIILMRAGIWR